MVRKRALDFLDRVGFDELFELFLDSLNRGPGSISLARCRRSGMKGFDLEQRINQLADVVEHGTLRGFFVQDHISIAREARFFKQGSICFMFSFPDLPLP